MLGVPSSPGGVGWTLLLAGGALAAILCAVFWRRRDTGRFPDLAAAVSLVVALAAIPYIAWRFVEDLRVTTRLHGYDAAAAGPVQAYLPGYLVDGAQRFIPRDATYAAAVGDDVTWRSARAAFPSLALETLFPRRSVTDPRSADYVLTWGISPARLATVDRVWTVRPSSGPSPAVRVGRVRR